MKAEARSISRLGRNLTRTAKAFALGGLPLIIALFLTAVAAQAKIQARLSSDKLSPGDAFTIDITGFGTEPDIGAAINGIQVPLEECAPGRLCGIGVIPLQTLPGKSAVRLKAGAKTYDAPVMIKKTAYPERHIRLSDSKVDLSQEDLKRVKREAERLKAIWDIRGKRLFREKFTMPLPNPLSTGYGVKRIFNKKRISVHQGIDIRGRLGEEVKASNSGVVILAEELFFGGNTVIINHGSGIFTVYMHLDSFRVTPGSYIEKDRTVGLVGSTGRSSGPHLHFGLKILGISANPLSIMQIRVR
jgi:murein DD-endopeptidase MepM/ murein hydrolase activator NlpD